MEQKILTPAEIAGKNIKHLIKNSEYKTQEEFAFQFGADLRTVSRWINNGINNLEVIYSIADFFDVNVYTILPAKVG